jgi:glycogen debranching enzyme
MIGAAGLRRYGRFTDAWRIIDGLFTAVASFDRTQMPELFAGLPRGELDAPVPYANANVPQAWSAGAVFLAVRILLGLEPDVPQGKVYVDPVLPPWCPELRLENVRIGAQRFTFTASRLADGSSSIDAEGGAGALTVVRGRPPRLALPVE